MTAEVTVPAKARTDVRRLATDAAWIVGAIVAWAVLFEWALGAPLLVAAFLTGATGFPVWLGTLLGVALTGLAGAGIGYSAFGMARDRGAPRVLWIAPLAGGAIAIAAAIAGGPGIAWVPVQLTWLAPQAIGGTAGAWWAARAS
jgi:hypothetical protein